MFLSVTDQIIILLVMVYGGFLLGLVFDIYRFIRDIFQFGKGITALGDIIFWLSGLILILSAIYKSNSGLVRVYQLLGFAIGTTVYFKFLSGIIRTLLYALVYCVKSLMYAMFKVIEGPAVLLSNILWGPCNRVKLWIARLAGGLGQHLQRYVPLPKNKK